MLDDVRLIATTIHGRVLVREARAAASTGVIVGFHGYLENAAIQMTRLASIPRAEAWTLVSVQGLHRVYRGRSEEVVASWMTSEDRDAMIADNIAYVGAAIESVPHDEATRIVYAGFSQGVAMAFRAALQGRVGTTAVVAVGGDVPPELLSDPKTRFPRALLARGMRDEWYTQAKLDADLAALAARQVTVQALVFDGAHEWNGAVSEAVAKFLSGL